jgi:hypothetical protein
MDRPRDFCFFLWRSGIAKAYLKFWAFIISGFGHNLSKPNLTLQNQIMKSHCPDQHYTVAPARALQREGAAYRSWQIKKTFHKAAGEAYRQYLQHNETIVIGYRVGLPEVDFNSLLGILPFSDRVFRYNRNLP